MQELYNGSFLDISYDAGSHILHANWKGYQSFDSGTAGCEQILEWTKKYGAQKILNDNSHVRGLWMGAAEWAARIWFPRLKQTEMKQFAWVYSPAKFSQISIDAALAALDPNEFGLRVFWSKDEALAWLLETP